MSAPESKAVFLSYASQDAEAALRLAAGLRAVGVEVWLDQEGGLVGGDEWDRKIRAQIASCALFVPVISANTQARKEGYFRLEWKLAEDRSHLIAKGVPFIMPVTVDSTTERGALVPDAFLAVQWTRLNGAAPAPQFFERVRKLLASPVAGASLADSRAAPTTSGRRPAMPLWDRGRTWLVPAALAVAVIVVLSLWQPWRSKTPPSSAPAPIASHSSPTAAPVTASIAVLAFENSSKDKDTEYFSDGVSEEILNTLANHPGLRVAARTSTFLFKGRSVPVAEIGSALNVAKVIEGSVRRAGDSVRITVKLINVADGYLVWSETFDRKFAEIFAVQSEIASQVVRRLTRAVDPASTPPAAPAPSRNPDAYDLYLRGRARQLAGDGPGARRFFEDALRLDPGYALAWARISQTHMRVILGGFDRSDATAERARSAAAQALRLDPRSPEALLANATVRLGVDYDFDGAEHALVEVERLRPNEPEASLLRAMLAMARGLWNENLLAYARRTEELDPQNTESLERLGLILQRAGQYAEADRLFARSVTLSVNRDAPYRFRSANHATTTGDIAAALKILESAPEASRSAELFFIQRGTWAARLGDVTAAAADFERARAGATRNPATGPRIWRARATYRLARLEEQLGHSARAQELFAATLSDLRKIDDDVPNLVRPPYERALVHARRGERTAALAALDESSLRAARNGDAYEMATVKLARAEVLATFGETEAALAVLRSLHKMGYGFGYSLRNDAEWDGLRGDEAFRRLMQETEARADAQQSAKK